MEAAKEKLQSSPLVELTVEEIGVLIKADELNPGHVEKMNDSYIHSPPEYFDSAKDRPTVNKDPLNYDLKETAEGPE